MLDYRVQRCQIIEFVFYTKALVNDILVGLEMILDYTGVGLERFVCSYVLLEKSCIAIISDFL